MDTVRSDKEGADPASVAYEAVSEGIRQEADVVLVNNKVFLEPRAYSPDPPPSVCYGGCAEYPSHFLVNEALRQKFLDLKEGAVVVSLKCLMGSGRSTTRGRTLPARGRSSSPALKERNVRLHYSSPRPRLRTE